MPMNSEEMSVAQALIKIQNWIDSGAYDNAIKASQEILEIEPGNQRALALMKTAQEKRLTDLKNQAPENPSMPTSTQTQPMPSPAPAPWPEPEESLEAPFENTPSTPTPEQNNWPQAEESPNDLRDFTDQEKRHLWMALLIPAILVILIGGGIIWALSRQSQNNQTSGNPSINLTTDLSYLEENEVRVKALKVMQSDIENFKLENGMYPQPSQIEDLVGKQIQDPRHGEIDKSGQVFAYIYGVYNNLEGENQSYILSALFEDSKGFGNTWHPGNENLVNFPNARDLEAENTIVIGKSLSSEDYNQESIIDTRQSGPKVKN